ncbi:pre-piRNA 3'-exonuclease trimmer-like isoform X1 [Tigriopus californicus]|uniref:pre-piRNA 3'-exonuclease trimmer-like isoform X1 n=1 Tax=Tigriopus californicus TaxID=6832 RepID=UPI0027DA97B9|nr:pre-piRNA 3'-exonuclease trimmer-like isoform X1 [Tigriopus californicus]|eukprot:TCALIF_09676-PA protein Name:"Similar to PNLDC1 Poly(A)-specific ribonuclease PARN-like domain-containing protein 1 (Homo sapiens)" AED:0.05 eAED:0.05 QI:26/1/1/1/0.9/0.81/11/117/534
MTEVVRENFKELLPVILGQISDASFVSFDAEFTTLGEFSLFDSLEQRYVKLRGQASSSVINQFGLSIFTQDPANPECYQVSCYNIYLFQRSFGPLNKPFLCEPQSLEFLTTHKFDFNKFIYQGIGYTNRAQESMLRSYLAKNGARCGSFEREIYGDELKDVCSKVSQWISAQEKGQELDIQCGNIPADLAAIYICFQFPNVWAFKSDDHEAQVRVKIVSSDERKELDKKQMETNLDEQRGFSQVIEAIIKAKKPIVGHNCLLDLVRIYQQFIDDLPSTLERFRVKVRILFPEIYDTKLVALNIKKDQPNEFPVALTGTRLDELYLALNGQKAGYQVPHSPNIVMDKETGQIYGDGYKKFHDAGFDAYVTGYVWLKLAHIASTIHYLSRDTIRTLKFKEHQAGVAPYKNHIKINHSSIFRLDLDKPVKGATTGPAKVTISSKFGLAINPDQFINKLTSYGLVEVQPLTRTQVIVATMGQRTCNAIIQDFANSEEYNVAPNNLRPEKMNKVTPILFGFVIGMILVPLCVVSRVMWR